MSDSTTTTVKTLTAEVRTLVVGSRQVTLSVYSQLDVVPPDAIEPFGRVQPKGAKWRSTQVVGRDDYDGALVRSWLPCEPFDLDRPSGLVTVYEHIGRGTTHSQTLAWPFGTPEGAVHDLAAEWPFLPLIVLAGLR